MYDEKKKKDEKKKGMEAMDGMTKTSIKDMKTKPDGCEPEEEEKPDLRSKYAMINLIKNKLRAAGQRDPMVMMKDPVMGEENISEMKPAPADAPKIDPKDYPDETKVKPKKGAIPKPKGGVPKVPNTERTPAPNDKSFDIMRPGGKNSPYNKDGSKKSPFKPGVEKKEIDPKKGTFKKNAIPATTKVKKDNAPKEKKKDTAPKYNPYGTGTANPSNMSGSTGP